MYKHSFQRLPHKNGLTLKEITEHKSKTVNLIDKSLMQAVAVAAADAFNLENSYLKELDCLSFFKPLVAAG